MIMEVPVKGYFEENSYFYIDDSTESGFLIDPEAEAEKLLAIIQKKGWNIEKILLTHGHFDHTGAVNDLRESLQIPVLAYKTADDYLLDARMNLSVFCGPPILVNGALRVSDGDIIRLDANPDFYLKVLYTPGHTTDSVTYYSENDRVAFVGDTIFKGSIGNYKYPGGNLNTLISSIQDSLFSLPEDTVLCSGHSEQTTVGTEKKRYRFRR